MAKVFVGHDWAEAHHDVHRRRRAGPPARRRPAARRRRGVARFHELVAAHVDDPAEVMIATETDRGLFVGCAGRGRVSRCWR